MRMGFTSLGFFPSNANAVSASGLDDMTTAWIEAMDETPSSAYQAWYNDLITGMKTLSVGGTPTDITTKFVALWVLAAHHEQAALINIIDPTNKGEKVGTLVHTPGIGMASNGTDGFVKSGIRPYAMTEAQKYALGIGTFNTTTDTSSACAIGTRSTNYITIYPCHSGTTSLGTVFGALNNEITYVSNVDPCLCTNQRISATQVQGLRGNGIQSAAASEYKALASNFQLMLLGRGTSDTAATDFITAAQALIFVSTSIWTAAEHGAFDAFLKEWLAASPAL